MKSAFSADGSITSAPKRQGLIVISTRLKQAAEKVIFRVISDEKRTASD